MKKNVTKYPTQKLLAYLTALVISALSLGDVPNNKEDLEKIIRFSIITFIFILLILLILFLFMSFF
ncbi:hypothetical protein H6775_03600 [Candidatus Nomurabacteria bacterium]|nr:hypothetical protein [Candidatus Nomurabacteria bacterium]